MSSSPNSLEQSSGKNSSFPIRSKVQSHHTKPSTRHSPGSTDKSATQSRRSSNGSQGTSEVKLSLPTCEQTNLLLCQWHRTPQATEILGCSASYLKRLRETHGGFLEANKHYLQPLTTNGAIRWNVSLIQQELLKRSALSALGGAS